MVKVSLNLLKELKWMFTFFGLTSATILVHFNKFLDWMLLYNIHIIFLFSCFCWFISTVFNVKIKNLENDINETIRNKETILLASIEDLHRDQLRKAIKDLIRKLDGVEVIDKEETINYIYDLRKSLNKLGLNGYSQKALDCLESRIKL